MRLLARCTGAAVAWEAAELVWGAPARARARAVGAVERERVEPGPAVVVVDSGRVHPWMTRVVEAPTSDSELRATGLLATVPSIPESRDRRTGAVPRVAADVRERATARSPARGGELAASRDRRRLNPAGCSARPACRATLAVLVGPAADRDAVRAPAVDP